MEAQDDTKKRRRSATQLEHQVSKKPKIELKVSMSTRASNMTTPPRLPRVDKLATIASSSLLLNLPREIRDMIYDECLKPFAAPPKSRYTEIFSTNIFFLCTQISLEARNRLLKANWVCQRTTGSAVQAPWT
ncbi:hypothetical protein EJ08DRAFT_319503 [Tothia fuscella]|uniref:F-box domain-containing protein n=1 Tax=Tothia fuscella TaxID=1048955 RepID=A0A9P4TWQ6_9PEZI|nr:hypothetical protein EJ08DRAFT_319503 [Tothia fuscella]